MTRSFVPSLKISKWHNQHPIFFLIGSKDTLLPVTFQEVVEGQGWVRSSLPLFWESWSFRTRTHRA